MAAAASASAAAAGEGPAIISTMHSAEHDMVLILDFGSQYSHIIVRRVRELGVYCELHSCLSPVSILDKGKIRGLILSGGPFSVYEDEAPHVEAGLLKEAEHRGIPILGVCYGIQELVHQMGGKVEAAAKREFGHADLEIKHAVSAATGGRKSLFDGLPASVPVWMSHGDKIISLPEGFVATAVTPSCEFAAIEHPTRHIFGLQFHPEVQHTPNGVDMLRNFITGICGCSGDWSMSGFVEEAVTTIRATVGPTGRVIGAVSGGVDSTVAAVLMHRAIGDRFHAVLVDNGLLRKDEAVNVLKRLRDDCGVNLSCVDASEEFLGNLSGVADPEAKRKIIGNTFIEVFEREAEKIGKCDFLLQGTLYPDVIESVSFRGPSATIKSHHNVGGLLDVMRLRLIEPLRELFKDEVRGLGMAMGLPRDSVYRHPFPGPGLAIRILGPVDQKACDLLREADAIYLEELRAAGEYDNIGQAFAVLLPCKSVGVMGDSRTYEKVLALRAAATSDFMTAKAYRMPYEVLESSSTRIINECRGINRVVYDVTSKPPGTIEWEDSDMAAAAASTAAAGKTVCVTGASGFVAGHLISQLLAKGNIVHGTVRSLSNATKTAHLTTLPGADERLKLFEADLLKAGSFDEALAGCSACYHTASPFFNDGVTDPEAQLIRPAVEGTLNVLNSCKSQGVKTIVVTSSTAAVYGRKEGNPPGHVITEEQWADADLATENKYHYVVSKIKAEQAVWKFASEEYPEARIVTLNPTLVIGPMFQPVMNTSSDAIARFFSGAFDAIPSGWITIVDVRNVAQAHIAAAENTAANGRYNLVAGTAKWTDLVDAMRAGATEEDAAKLPTAVASAAEEKPWRYSMKAELTVDCSKAVKDLGISFIPPAKSVQDLCADTVFRTLLHA